MHEAPYGIDGFTVKNTMLVGARVSILGTSTRITVIKGTERKTHNLWEVRKFVFTSSTSLQEMVTWSRYIIKFGTGGRRRMSRWG